MTIGDLIPALDFSCNILLTQEVKSAFGIQVVRENVDVEELNKYADCKVISISHGHCLEIMIKE